jgi:hypothetical protein
MPRISTLTAKSSLITLNAMITREVQILLQAQSYTREGYSLASGFGSPPLHLYYSQAVYHHSQAAFLLQARFLMDTKLKRRLA